MSWSHTLVFGNAKLHTVRPRLIRARLLGTVYLYGWLTFEDAVYILMRKLVLVREQENMNPSGRITLKWINMESYETYAYCVSTGEIFRVNGERDLVETPPKRDYAEADFYELLVSEGVKPSMALARAKDLQPDFDELELERSFCGGWTFFKSNCWFSDVQLFKRFE